MQILCEYAFFWGKGLLIAQFSQRCVQSLTNLSTLAFHSHSSPVFQMRKPRAREFKWQNQCLNPYLFDFKPYAWPTLLWCTPLASVRGIRGKQWLVHSLGSNMCLAMVCDCCFEQKVGASGGKPETWDHSAWTAAVWGQLAPCWVSKWAAVPISPEAGASVWLRENSLYLKRNFLILKWATEGG